MTYLFCPGFLGVAEDFAPLTIALSGENIKVLNYFEKHSSTPAKGTLLEWATQTAEHFRDGTVFVGYSAGARIAIHLALAMAQHGQRPGGLFLMSGNPGFEIEDPVLRKKFGIDWAKRFESESWDSLIKDWNNVSVLATSTPVTPQESRFSRAALSHALEHWGPTDHGFQVSALKALKCPIAWIFGEKDAKYALVANKIEAEGVPGQVQMVPNAGHRVLKDQPQITTEKFKSWRAKWLQKHQ